ncbi:putative geraniol 8-hydroxylase [Medicago truncatula]|uniref:Putative geraniol 8-hydroxylase n=1 Tax=Medicago truncatula TaxID=3880 RepID=A0A396HRG1_MEDTR|nr:putative geraniol 8-hydroxylase [Medicago truncatula]
MEADNKLRRLIFLDGKINPLFYSLFATKMRNKTNSKLPPGPFPLPIVGNLFVMNNKPHKSLAKLAKIYGPILSLKLGQVTTIVVSSADLAKEILQTHDSLLSDRTVPHALTAFNHDQFGVGFLPLSPLWREMRKVCKNQLFSNKSLDANQCIRRTKIDELIGYVSQRNLKGEAIDMGKVAFRTSINMLSNTIFSVDFANNSAGTNENKENKDLVMNMAETVGKPNMADFFPLLRLIDPQGIKKTYMFYIGKLFNVFDNIIDQRLKLREEDGFFTNNDMLDSLLDIPEENRKELDREKIEHLLHDLLVGGTDTTTYTLEWAMAELLHNPNIMSKVKKELEDTIGIGNPLEESDITRLPYLQAVIKETLRLHPIAPLLLPRKAKEDVEVNGYTIPKDAQIFVNVWAIGRDPEVWDNPYLFSPERFLGTKLDIKGQNFQLTPFGSGRRICPGLPLAMRMLHMMLGSLLISFDWKLENDMKPEEIDMEDAIQGLALRKCESLRVIPTKISN